MSLSVQVEPNEIFPKYVFSFQSNFLTKDLADDVVDYLSNLSEDDWYPSDDPSEARGTKNYSMLDLPMLQNLKQEIIFAMESTAQQFFSHDVENLEITNSWAVKVKQNNYLSPHKHANTYFAGTICLSESAVGVQFFDFDFNHTFSLFPATNKKNLSEESAPIYDRCSFPSKPGKILFWPSAYLHGILKQPNKETRYSLAFNSAPLGVFGPYVGKLNLSKTPQYNANN